MNDCTLFGFALGMLAGAMLVAKSDKAREVVEKGQKAVKEQIQKLK